MRTPVVLLHGALDGPEVWARIAPRLERAGWDVRLDRAERIARPDEAVRVVVTLPEGGAHLVGHSRGATVASWVAVEHPELVKSLALIASPPVASEVFRAAFARRLPRASEAERPTLEYLAAIPDDDFPQHALRRYRGRALVVEYEDDPLYSPTHTMFWRLFLPYGDFERVPGGHRALADDDASAQWLAQRLDAHLRAAESDAR